jgi:predicted PurR-regulated permease PerM
MHIVFGTFASIVLIIFMLLFAGVTVALFGVIAFTLRKVEQQIEKVTNMAAPVVAKATHTLDTVQRITENVGEKADTILTKGEALTDQLTDKVEQTSSVVQKTVTSPLINLSSLITGLSTGLSVWSRAASENAREAGAGHAPPHRSNGASVHANGTSAQTEERVILTPNGR